MFCDSTEFYYFFSNIFSTFMILESHFSFVLSLLCFGIFFSKMELRLENFFASRGSYVHNRRKSAHPHRYLNRNTPSWSWCWLVGRIVFVDHKPLTWQAQNQVVVVELLFVTTSQTPLLMWWVGLREAVFAWEGYNAAAVCNGMFRPIRVVSSISVNDDILIC